MIHKDFGCEGSPSAVFIVETTDREEALAFATNAIAPMKVRYGASAGMFAFRLKANRLVETELLRHRQHVEGGATFDVQYEDTHLTLEIPVEGRAGLGVAGQAYELVANRTALLASPGQRTVMRDPGNVYRAHSYKFDRRLLERRFRQLTGSECVRDIVFDPVLDLTSVQGKEFLALASIPFASETGLFSIWNNPTSAALFEEMLVNVLLTSFPHSRSAEFEKAAPLTSARAVQKCEEYLAAHAEEVITIGDIAKAIGVSVRSLQRTFQKTAGTTPMRRLKEIRLDRARARLLAGRRDASVTQVALNSGFSHMGAFASDYKTRFGESPSATLSKAD